MISSNWKPFGYWTPKAALSKNLLTTQSASVEIEFVVLQGGKYLQPTFTCLRDASGNFALLVDRHESRTATQTDGKGTIQILDADPG